jgi:hypothetical protein
MKATRAVLSIVIGLGFAACGDDSGSDQADAGGMDAPTREVTCTDESVKDLTLFDRPNNAPIRLEASDQGTFKQFVDASGGGVTPTMSFVYGRFTEHGIEQVDISDEDAFTSLAWDIAFRRYVIRLNSGVSGPGDVTAARTAPSTTFDSLSDVPDDLDYRTEAYYTDDCTFVNDGSGLPGGPGTALASFWSYKMCVAMTHNVYVIQLEEPKQRHLKLEVTSYYTPTNQQICDTTGQVPNPTGAGNMRLQWAFLD